MLINFKLYVMLNLNAQSENNKTVDTASTII